MPSLHFTPRDTACSQTVSRGFRFPVRLRGALMVSSQTVLVVEDNDEAREGLAVLLRREGYEVLLAEHGEEALGHLDRKSTRLNSSHLVISYAVFCLKKKKTTPIRPGPRNTALQPSSPGCLGATWPAASPTTPTM